MSLLAVLFYYILAMAATMFAMGSVGGLVPLGLVSLTLGLSLSFTLAASSAETRGTAMGLLGCIMDIGYSSGPLAAGMIIAAFGNAAGFFLFGLGHPLLKYRLCFQWAQCAGDHILIF